MNKLFKTALLALFLSLSAVMLSAQERTQAYYNTHEKEILPDARASFQKGEYQRAIELCKWHYIIVGDNAARQLQNLARRCADLTTEMIDFQDKGELKSAKGIANDILAINPLDPAAKEVLATEDPVPEEKNALPEIKPVQVPESEPEREPEPMKEETVNTKEEAAPVPTEQTDEESTGDKEEEQQQGPFEDGEPVQKIPATGLPYKTRVVLKGGAEILDLKAVSQSLAYGGAIGVYDIGRSRFGLEAGAFYCPKLCNATASLLEAEAGIVIRAAKGVYPKAMAGFFTCKSASDKSNVTNGLCAGAGLTFVIAQHFCLELFGKYYPNVHIQGYERVTTANYAYDFPSEITVLSSGFCPGVRIGISF